MASKKAKGAKGKKTTSVQLAVIIAAAVLVVAAGALAAVVYLKPGGSSNTSRVVVDEPAGGSSVDSGSTIRGHTTGGGVVHVWVKGVNIDVPAETIGSTWQYRYPGGLGGVRTLVFSSVQDGEWGPETEATFTFTGTTETIETGTGEHVSDHAPSMFAQIFRPIEDVLDAAVAFINAGVRSVIGGVPIQAADLNGDGVPDGVQGTPFAPNSGILSQIPFGYAALVLVAGIIVAGVVFAVRGNVFAEYWAKRQESRVKARGIEASVAIKKLAAERDLKGQQLRGILGLKGRELEVKAKLAEKTLDAQRVAVESNARLAQAQLDAAAGVQKARIDAIRAIKTQAKE